MRTTRAATTAQCKPTLCAPRVLPLILTTPTPGHPPTSPRPALLPNPGARSLAANFALSYPEPPEDEGAGGADEGGDGDVERRASAPSVSAARKVFTKRGQGPLLHVHGDGLLRALSSATLAPQGCRRGAANTAGWAAIHPS